MFVLETHHEFFTFPNIKKYSPKNPMQPIYFLLEDPEKKSNVLGRELTSSEDTSNFKNICSLHEVRHEGFKPCLIFGSIESESETNSIVESYEKAFATLEKR